MTPSFGHKWDSRFMALAKHVAMWSKDPSTQTGCVLARPDRSIASVGYNGFPRGVRDTDVRLNDRPTKLALVVHAEPNAVLAAGGPVVNCTAYVWPWAPCAPCAGVLIQAGIVAVHAPMPTEAQLERWGDSWALAEMMLAEAGVELNLRRLPTGPSPTLHEPTDEETTA